jgi:hypothetical protein
LNFPAAFSALPPGDPKLPSPPQSMLLGADCIHLSANGYLAVAQNLWDGYYEARFTGIFASCFESGIAGWSAVVRPPPGALDERPD